MLQRCFSLHTTNLGVNVKVGIELLLGGCWSLDCAILAFVYTDGPLEQRLYEFLSILLVCFPPILSFLATVNTIMATLHVTVYTIPLHRQRCVPSPFNHQSQGCNMLHCSPHYHSFYQPVL